MKLLVLLFAALFIFFYIENMNRSELKLDTCVSRTDMIKRGNRTSLPHFSGEDCSLISPQPPKIKTCPPASSLPKTHRGQFASANSQPTAPEIKRHPQFFPSNSTRMGRQKGTLWPKVHLQRIPHGLQWVRLMRLATGKAGSHYIHSIIVQQGHL